MLNNNFTKEKEIAFLLDGFEESKEIAEKIKTVFTDWKIRNVFWDEFNENFFSLEGEKKDFLPFIIDSDLVINLINQDREKFLEIEKKINFVKSFQIQNSFKTISLFSTSLGTKKVLKARGIKTPVFEKTNNRERKEVFVNFPQPSKVHDGLIEEKIKGEEFELFIFRNREGEILCLDTQGGQEIVDFAKSVFDKLGIEKFASLKLISSERRGNYVLDVNVDFDVLLKDEAKNLKIMKKAL